VRDNPEVRAMSTSDLRFDNARSVLSFSLPFLVGAAMIASMEFGAVMKSWRARSWRQPRVRLRPAGVSRSGIVVVIDVVMGGGLMPSSTACCSWGRPPIASAPRCRLTTRRRWRRSHRRAVPSAGCRLALRLRGTTDGLDQHH
jgi:hypothetical protein